MSSPKEEMLSDVAPATILSLEEALPERGDENKSLALIDTIPFTPGSYDEAMILDMKAKIYGMTNQLSKAIAPWDRAVQLSDHHDVLLISDGGTLVRTRAAEISQVGRNTQGVTLIRLAADETLQAVERVDASLDEEAGSVESEAIGVAGGEVEERSPE